MHKFEQGGLDSLCGIYSLVNAEQIINDTSNEDSQKLFNLIIDFFDKEGILPIVLKEGMLLKHIKAVLDEVIGNRIHYKKLHFAGVVNPDLNTFWKEISFFLNNNQKSAVLLGISGVHDHWTVIKKITERQIQLIDSDGLSRLHRVNCTTSEEKGKRHHILYPAQTYFLKCA